MGGESQSQTYSHDQIEVLRRRVAELEQLAVPTEAAASLDLTREKQALARLSESEVHNQHFLENFQGIAFQARCVDLIPIFFRGNVEALTGYTSEDFLTKRIHWMDLMHPEDREQHLEIIDQMRNHPGQAASDEYRICARDGQVHWVRCSGQVTQSKQGDQLIVGTIYDITEHKLAELELRESQRELATLMSNLPGMAYRCANDPDWTVAFVSDGVRALTGYAPEDLIGNRKVSYGNLIVEEDREMVNQSVQAALAKRSAFELSYRIRDIAGELRWVWERGVGVFSADGELLFLEGFISDITQRHRAEEERDKLEAQLRQAHKMEAVGQLAGGMAHDFNNILTAIFGNVEMALGEVETARPQASNILDNLHQIEQGAERASTLTRQLLAFSRQQVIHPEVVDINLTLRDLEKMLCRLITENITLELQCEPNLFHVEVDPGQLEQVVVNLTVNARDAMPDGGHLTLETKNVVLDEAFAATHPEAAVGPHVLLAVSDTGCGIDQETRERLFEPFYTTKPLGYGTGLGLSMVYGFLKQSGGTVVVYSEPGQGTTFKIYLPAVLTPANRPAHEPTAAPDPTGSETIIVCEDDPAVRKLTVLLLKDAGYTVLCAESVRDALQLVAEHAEPLDLLLTDVIMPDMNGRKLSDTITALRPEIRTLFVSGYSANVIAHHGVLKENVDLLEKPYSRRQLLTTVRQVLDRVQTTKS